MSPSQCTTFGLVKGVELDQITLPVGQHIKLRSNKFGYLFSNNFTLDSIIFSISLQ